MTLSNFPNSSVKNVGIGTHAENCYTLQHVSSMKKEKTKNIKKKRGTKNETEKEKSTRGRKNRVPEKQRTSKALSFENLPLRIKCLSILVLGSLLNPKMYSRSSHIQCIIYGTCHHNRVFSEIHEAEKSEG
jgi:predicted nucleotidyltransferase